MDSTFAHAQRHGLVWLPQIGMGHYPVSVPDEEVYNDEYWDKYVTYAQTDLGRALTKARAELLMRWMRPNDIAVDVGIGCGQFVTALRGTAFETYGFDVNTRGIAWLKEANLYKDPYREMVDILTFWDVLEHLPDPALLVRSARRAVLVSIPIFTDDVNLLHSRHFRPTEHRWYWTSEGFKNWMTLQGFTCVEHNLSETLLGRDSIHTFAFVRTS